MSFQNNIKYLKNKILRKQKSHISHSLQAIAWQRFFKKTQGKVLVGILGFFVFIAVAGYLITPDSTPACNEQILEINLQKPFSKITFLKVRRNQSIERHNFLYIMLFGQESSYTKIPIKKYYFVADSIEVELFNEVSPYNLATYHLADVCFPLSDKHEITKQNEQIEFYTVDGKKQHFPIANLQKMALQNIDNQVFILGTDRYGRDILSRMIIGSRVSLSVGFVSVAIALLIGVLLGAVAGYYRGKIDSIIMWFINVVWAIPSLLLAIAISFVLGSGFWQIFVAIGLTMWVDIARVTRGEFLSLREKEFVEAAKGLGFRDITVIFKHILPNITGTLAVIAAGNFASAILTEAGLSFLGLGIKPPLPSWGSMIKENYAYIILDYPYMAIIPAIAIMILVFCFMLCGNLLRDAMDVKSEK
ncbi:MAG: ABC transporter permease [Bacteroidales bacterium]|jgi:peptide/nickel transport system permease protein|nr:ABC transporter permease [Bacteroidales bacterium]